MQCLPSPIKRKSREGALRKQIASHRPRPVYSASPSATFRFSLSANNTELRILFESICLANGQAHCVGVRIDGEGFRLRNAKNEANTRQIFAQFIRKANNRSSRNSKGGTSVRSADRRGEKVRARFAESINQTVCNPSSNELKGMSHFFSRSRVLFKPERNSIYRLWAHRKNASACTAQILSEQIEHVMEARRARSSGDCLPKRKSKGTRGRGSCRSIDRHGSVNTRDF